MVHLRMLSEKSASMHHKIKSTSMMKRILNGILEFTLLLEFACDLTPKNQEQKEVDSPNVIMILVDDMGYGDLSLYGQKTFSTPILDKMATEGIYFTNMYTGSTVCAPSRASLMTGKHTGHTLQKHINIFLWADT